MIIRIFLDINVTVIIAIYRYIMYNVLCLHVMFYMLAIFFIIWLIGERVGMQFLVTAFLSSVVQSVW